MDTRANQLVVGPIAEKREQVVHWCLNVPWTVPFWQALELISGWNYRDFDDIGCGYKCMSRGSMCVQGDCKAVYKIYLPNQMSGPVDSA
jgi:hypothetical protein